MDPTADATTDATPAAAPGIARLVADGMFDAELAALVSLLLEVRVPAIVAGPVAPARDALADALVELLAPDARLVTLADEAEEFDWLPEAIELGWRREVNVIDAGRRDATPRASSSTTVIRARDLAGVGPEATGGGRARLVVRALALGYGLVATMEADGLEGVLDRLADPAIGTDEDERSRIGVVLALGSPAAGPRVLAAHWVRPLSRDQHGHLQRLPPAVLATWNPDVDRWDHFAWGVLPELAIRTGRRPLDLEREQARRAGALRSTSGTGMARSRA